MGWPQQAGHQDWEDDEPGDGAKHGPDGGGQWP